MESMLVLTMVLFKVTEIGGETVRSWTGGNYFDVRRDNMWPVHQVVEVITILREEKKVV